MTTPFEFRAVLFAVFWKSGIALGAALCISRMLRNRSADLRRLVFSTTIVAMFVAAAVAPILPRWTAVTPLWFHFQRLAPAAVAGSSLSSPMADDASELTAQVRRPMPPQTSSRRIDINAWLIPLVWFAGAGTLLTRFAINLRGLYRLRKASDAVTDAGLLANVARFGRRVRLWRNDAIGAPVTWGIARPVILVPAGFEELPAESRDAVIRHELAHIQAHDFPMRGLAEIARALIWFQPLVWIVWRQLREEQELACDNCVLAAGGKPSAYAKLLLDWDARPGTDSLIAVGIAHRSCLKRRLYALLDTDLRRDTVASAGVAGALFLALAAALPLAAIGFAQAVPVQPAPAHAVLPPPAQSAQAPTAQGEFEVASVKASTSHRMGAILTYPGGRVEFLGCTLQYLIEQAFSIQPFQVSGGPGWMQTERYDIEAKPSASSKSSQSRQFDAKATPNEEQRQMLLSLLVERFQLKYHRETREGPVYLLVKGNKPLRLVDPQDKNEYPWAGVMRTGNGLRGANESMDDLAWRLSPYLGRPVLNRTEISGSYDFLADYPLEDGRADIVGMIVATVKDLGLKLEATKGPIETIVIEHAGKPSAN